MLPKIILYSSSTFVEAGCIHSNYTWVKQQIHIARPREKIYFKLEEVKATIVIYSGLCSSLNDVISDILLSNLKSMTIEVEGFDKQLLCFFVM